MVFCVECGAKLKDGESFCPYCGTKNQLAGNSTNIQKPVSSIKSTKFKVNEIKSKKTKEERVNEAKGFIKKYKVHISILLVIILIGIIVIPMAASYLEEQAIINSDPGFQGEPSIKINQTLFYNASSEIWWDGGLDTEELQEMSDAEWEAFDAAHTKVVERYDYDMVVFFTGLKYEEDYHVNTTFYDSNGNIVDSKLDNFTAEQFYVDSFNNGSRVYCHVTNSVEDIAKIKVQLLDDNFNLLAEDESPFTKEMTDAVHLIMNGNG